MLADWLRQLAVARWWGGPDRQIALIRDDIPDGLMGQVIAMRGQTLLGYAQSYPAHHWPAPHFAHLPAETIALDVFNGPDGWGQGSEWLRALGDLLRARTAILVIDPDPENQRAIRAYEKAGFSGAETGMDAEGQRTRVMTRRR